MSSNGWTEVTMSQTPIRWRFDEQNVIEGLVDDVSYPVTSYGEGMRVVIAGADGEKYQFFAPTHLRRLFEHSKVEVGEYVRITYRGRGARGHLFSLAVRREK